MINTNLRMRFFLAQKLVQNDKKGGIARSE